MDKFAYCRTYEFDFLNHLPLKEFYREYILNLIKLTNCKSYLELGVSDINHLKEITPFVSKCSGVDVTDWKHEDPGDVNFFNMSTDQFFEINQNFFDIIFIDADHSFEQVRIDFENSLKVLNEFGIIILHDTDPLEPILLGDKYCSDSYKMVDYIYLNHPDLNLITFPIHETGMSFVMRRKDRRIKKFL